MKNISTGTRFSSFTELAEAMDIKQKKVDTERLKAQQEKFCKCFKCKGQMTYILNTNILMCQTPIKDAEGNHVMNKQGNYITCGNIRYLDNESSVYATKLFS